MLLNENPCKGFTQIRENLPPVIHCNKCPNWGDMQDLGICLEQVKYHAQRELLGKVVEWLENLGDEPRWVTYKLKAKVIADELKKELQG